MNARDLMTPDPVLVKRRTTLRTAARLMRDFRVGVLPVVSITGLVGILTDRDLAVRAVADGVSPLTGYVEDSMSRHVATCGPEESADSIARKMVASRCRRIVVVDERGLPVGIVSTDDLLRGNGTATLAQDVLARLGRDRDSTD